MLRADTRIIRNKDVLQANLQAESIALLKVGGMDYYGLDGPAARIWQLLESEQTVDSICSVLTTEFDVSMDVCLHDTLELLRSLLSENLVTVVGE